MIARAQIWVALLAGVASPVRRSAADNPSSVELLLERVPQAQIRSPVLESSPVDEVTFDLSASAAPFERRVEGEEPLRIHPLPAAVLLDEKGEPVQARWTRDGHPVESPPSVRFIPCVQVIHFLSEPCCADLRRRRDPNGDTLVGIDRSTVLSVPIVRHGGRLRLRFEPFLLAKKDGFGAPEKQNPRVTLRLGDEPFTESFDRRMAAFDVSFKEHVGPQTLSIEFDIGSEVLVGDHVAFRTLTMEIEDRQDRLLAPASASEEGLVLCYRPAPAWHAFVLPSASQNRIVWEGFMVMGRALLRCVRPQPLEIRLDSNMAASVTQPLEEIEFQVDRPGPHRLEIEFHEPPRSRVHLVQPHVLYGKLNDPESTFDQSIPAVRGLQSLESFHPLVRHVRVEGDARLSLLMVPGTDVSLEVSTGGPAVLEFAAAVVRLPEDSRITEPLTLSVSQITGATEQALFSQELRPRKIWQEFKVELSATDQSPCRMRWQVKATSTGSVGSTDLLCAVAEPRIVREDQTRPPNLLIYLVDTLRADHVSCYGYPRATTPHLDQLAGDGVVFERAYSQAPWTRPSVASLMTGRIGSFHGATRDRGLSPELVTLAERMRDRGYRTAAFLANPNVHGKSLNFEQGFGEFHTLDESNSDGRADDLNGQVLPWLAEHSDQPFFLYVHSVDPHAPYDPPLRTRGVFNRGYSGRLTPHRTSRPALEAIAEPSKDDLRYLLDLYDEEILFNDQEIGELLDALRRRRLYHRTIIVVLSDHGEEFHEHGGFGHGGRLWEELLRVPLILKLSGPDAPRGVRVKDPVRVIDILPTLADWLCWDSSGDPFQGVSLRDWWRGQDGLPLLEVVAEEEPLKRCLVQGGWKFIEHVDPAGGPTESWLFDLGKAPLERFNLAEQQAELLETWRAKLSQVIQAYEQRGFRLPKGFAARMTREEIEALDALGYVEGER